MPYAQHQHHGIEPMRQVLRATILRLGLASGRLATRRHPGAGLDIRSETTRRRPLILLWAMGHAADAPEVIQQLDFFLPQADVVLVVDTLLFQPASVRGALIEALPDFAARALMPSHDWASYLSRRISRIRNAWNADFEITLGIGPAAYVAGPVGAPAPSAVPTSTDLSEEFERIEPPG